MVGKMTTDVKRSITSDDSSEEDEPITEAAVQSKRDDLNVCRSLHDYMMYSWMIVECMDGCR